MKRCEDNKGNNVKRERKNELKEKKNPKEFVHKIKPHNRHKPKKFNKENKCCPRSTY